jgi:hypothetical protein
MVVAHLASESGGLFAERQQGIALSAAETTTGMFAEEKDHEGEDETQTDREGERYDGHGDADLRVGTGIGRVTLAFGNSGLCGGNRGWNRTGAPAARPFAGCMVVAE